MDDRWPAGAAGNFARLDPVYLPSWRDQASVAFDPNRDQDIHARNDAGVAILPVVLGVLALLAVGGFRATDAVAKEMSG
jgi:hypothetical protein